MQVICSALGSPSFHPVFWSLWLTDRPPCHPRALGMKKKVAQNPSPQISHQTDPKDPGLSISSPARVQLLPSLKSKGLGSQASRSQKESQMPTHANPAPAEVTETSPTFTLATLTPGLSKEGWWPGGVVTRDCPPFWTAALRPLKPAHINLGVCSNSGPSRDSHKCPAVPRLGQPDVPSPYVQGPVALPAFPSYSSSLVPNPATGHPEWDLQTLPVFSA